MKQAYPVIFAKIPEGGFMATIPDFDDAGTHGESLPEAMEMARDAIGALGLSYEEDGLKLPSPTALDRVQVANGELVSLVDVDFTDYRRRTELKTVKKNCTLPSWLNAEAEKANVNFSAVLQNALKKELHLA
ncbi:MAG: type II toxin-antitoxin system HicB family antitoxin [Clostridium sp.]|nr:type II toxin-antitoxin system HicB family antitoxin [Clostridium sp.]